MRSTLLLVAILILLLGVYFFLVPKGNTSLDESETDFAIKDTSLVSSITLEKIVKGEKFETLELRKISGVWKVNNTHPALKPRIRHFLQTLTLIAVKEPLKDKAQESALELLKKTHTLVTIANSSGAIIKKYFVGATNNELTANIVMLEGADNAYLVSRPGITGYIGIEYTTNSDPWTEKLLFSIQGEDLSGLYLDYGDKDLDSSHSFRIWKNKPSDQKWMIETGNKKIPTRYDAERIAEYVVQFKGDVYAADFAEEEIHGLGDSLRVSKPKATLGFREFSGDSGFVKIFIRQSRGESYYALSSTTSEVLIAQPFAVDKYFISAENFVLK